MDLSVSPKDEICFLRVCHHISTGIYKELVGPQDRSGRVRKFPPPPRFEPKSIHHVPTKLPRPDTVSEHLIPNKNRSEVGEKPNDVTQKEMADTNKFFWYVQITLFLYSFFWVIPRGLSSCADVSAHCMFHLHR
jgi:hypothetical protein